MNKEEFLALQQQQASSGLGLMRYLKREGIPYSNYSYWRAKFSDKNRDGQLAPITLKTADWGSHKPQQLQSGIMVMFPNGVRVVFGADAQSAARDLFHQCMTGHVLP